MNIILFKYMFESKCITATFPLKTAFWWCSEMCIIHRIAKVFRLVPRSFSCYYVELLLASDMLIPTHFCVA